jgi:hypothetical protein
MMDLAFALLHKVEERSGLISVCRLSDISIQYNFYSYFTLKYSKYCKLPVKTKAGDIT